MNPGVYALTLEGSHRAVGLAIPAQPIVRNGTRGLMHIASVGTWLGHPSGPFEFTAELFDRLCTRFQERGGSALLVDYDHRSGGKRVEPEQNKASGWIRSLWRSGDGADAELWASVEFTQAAAGMIAAGEYLYCSPVVAWSVPDKRTAEVGPELLKVALTNEPFQDSLEAISLELADSRTETEPNKPEASVAEPKTDQPKTEDPKTEEPKTEDKKVEADAASDPLMTIAGELGVDLPTIVEVVTENIDQITKALRQALEAKKPGGVPQVALSSDDRIAALEAKLKDAEDARIATKVDSLIALGRCTDEQRDWAIFEFSRDPKSAEAKFATQVVPVGTMQAGNRDQVVHKAKVSELSDQERVTFAALTAYGEAKGQTPAKAKAEALNLIVSRREGAGKAA